MRRISPSVVFLIALLFAGSASAYTIILKDGSSLEAREKYRIEGDKALIYLLNGTLVTYELSKIDEKRTDEANISNFGNAVLFEKGKAKTTGKLPPPGAEKETLSQLIKKRQADLRAPEQSRRSEGASRRDRAPGAAPILADLSAYADIGMVGELQQYFRSQGVDTVGIYQGSSPSRPLIIANATSEATVFRALATAASALLEMRARHGDSLPSLELRLEATGRSNAGQFSFDPDKAHELVDGKIEASAFFVKYVEF